MDNSFRASAQGLASWSKVSSRYIHHEKWFNLRADKVIKGNGQPMEPYYVFEFSDWVNVLPVTREGKVILVKQYRYAYGDFSLEIPGGIMDPGEADPMAAAKRELLEETGYDCDAIYPSALLAANPATQNNTLHCYVATGCTKQKEISLDENEEIETLFVTIEELKTLLRENRIIQSLHSASIFYGLLKLEEIKF